MSYFASMGRVVDSLDSKWRLPNCRPTFYDSLERSLPHPTALEFESYG